MKKTLANIRTLAALLIASATIAACSNDDGIVDNAQPAQQQAPQVYTLTLQAGKADNAQTRALDLDGTKLVAKWAAGEQVTVTRGTASLGTLSVKEGSVSADGQTCTFTGTLTGNIATDDVLTLTYHPVVSTDYSSQTGTLESAAACDMATASVTVTAVDDGTNTITAGTAEFETQTAVLKITMLDAGGNKINATELQVSAAIGSTATNIFSFSPTDATYTANGNGILYFALPSAATVAMAKGMTTEELAALPITFSAKVGDDTYTATKTGYPFAAGKYYETTLNMAKALTYPVALSVVTADYIGSVVCSDGNVYPDKTAVPAGTTACAIIAYVGSATGDDNYKHGLAIAMKDAAAGDCVKWSSSSKDEWLDNYTDVSQAVSTSQSGLSNSQYYEFDNETDYPAFYAALHNTITTSDGISADAPDPGTSGWFLPSLYQWNKIVQGLSGQSADLSDYPNDNYTASSLNAKITAAGGTGLKDYDAYWSSTEYDGDHAWLFYAPSGLVTDKSPKNEYPYCVRSAFAF